MSTQKCSNNRIRADDKKRRSLFLVALLFAAGDVGRCNTIATFARKMISLSGDAACRCNGFRTEVSYNINLPG